MSNLVWIIVVIMAIGLIIWLLAKKKKEPSLPEKTETPSPPSPSETPEI